MYEYIKIIIIHISKERDHWSPLSNDNGNDKIGITINAKEIA